MIATATDSDPTKPEPTTPTFSPIDWTLLALPFSPDEIEWRAAQCGKNSKGFWCKVLAYLTNRAIMHRLDDVVGPARWWNQFISGPQGGVLCGITILTEHGPVTKWDGAENTDIESVKGGISDSMKRAAVQWGIGRYLYELSEGWAEIDEKGSNQGKTKENEFFKWNPPKLPGWAMPPKTRGASNGANNNPPPVVDYVAKARTQLRELGCRLTNEFEIAVDVLTKGNRKVADCKNAIAAKEVCEALETEGLKAAAWLAIQESRKAVGAGTH